jgi:hypothetical protein
MSKHGKKCEYLQVRIKQLRNISPAINWNQVEAHNSCTARTGQIQFHSLLENCTMCTTFKKQKCLLSISKYLLKNFPQWWVRKICFINIQAFDEIVVYELHKKVFYQKKTDIHLKKVM